MRIFAQLILPLSGPVIATTVILQFMSSWNNFFLPLVLTLSRPELRTLGVGMFAFQGQYYVVRRRCEAFFHEHLGTTEVEFVQLFAGSSPATSEPIMRMDELARTVSITPVLVAELADKSEPWKQPGLSAVLAVYFEAFGHRASDWEYIGPTLAERPDRAIELLREAVARVAANQPSAVETARQRRDTSVAALRRKLPNAPLRASFDRLLKDAQATFAIHEDNINLYMTACGVMRYALLEAGARLVQRGLLADAERVFFLRRGELECACRAIRRLNWRPGRRSAGRTISSNCITIRPRLW